LSNKYYTPLPRTRIPSCRCLHSVMTLSALLLLLLFCSIARTLAFPTNISFSSANTDLETNFFHSLSLDADLLAPTNYTTRPLRVSLPNSRLLLILYCQTSTASPLRSDAVQTILTLGRTTNPKTCRQDSLSGCDGMINYRTAALGMCGVRGWAMKCQEAHEYLLWVALRCARTLEGVRRTGGFVRVEYPGMQGMVADLHIYHT
jgi:hypothetical protein